MGALLLFSAETYPDFRQRQGCGYDFVVLYLYSHMLIFERGERMLHNNIELDLKTKLIESGTTQTEIADKLGVSLSYARVGSRSSIRPS